MKVLMLSTDQKIFDLNSEAHQRMIGYGGLFDELHIIVYTKCGLISEKKVDISANTFVYPTNSKYKLLYIFNIFFIAQKILKERTSKQKWVITSQDPFETGLAGYLLKRFYCLSLQIQIHTDFLSPYFSAESIKNKLRVILGKIIVKRADGIRVVSERIKKSIIKIYPSLVSRVVVLPVFVDIEKIRHANIRVDLHKKYPQFDFIILMASRLTREKNIPMTIGAMKVIVEKYHKIGLIIVGSGPEQNNIQSIIKEHNLQKNVILEPWTDDMPSYYKTADCFVLTSNHEGYGRTVIEAMASGCPMIMTDVGVAGELVKNDIYGAIISVGDIVALTSVLNSIIDDLLYRKALCAVALIIINNMTSKDSYYLQYKLLFENI
ncbi:MAG: glycosyltransferase [Patescibacteria group bacterium]